MGSKNEINFIMKLLNHIIINYITFSPSKWKTFEFEIITQWNDV
jgi:hypothetical protein